MKLIVIITEKRGMEKDHWLIDSFLHSESYHEIVSVADIYYNSFVQ